jgi:uncharacterized protein
VSKDEARAAALFTKACDAGSALGCSNLGILFEQGRGVGKDEARAAALYTKACDAGNEGGCYFLGNMFVEGRGVGKDEARAASLLTKACDRGFAPGCSTLGLLFEHGHGVVKDEARAAALYTKACDGELAPGGCKARFERVVPMFAAKPCGAAFAAGCHHLGLLFEQGRGVGKAMLRTSRRTRRARRRRRAGRRPRPRGGSNRNSARVSISNPARNGMNFTRKGLTSSPLGPAHAVEPIASKIG